MKKIILLCLLILMLVSCESTDNIAISKIDEQSRELIKEADLLLLEYNSTKNAVTYKKAVEIINILQERSVNNKYFEAKVLGLLGESEYANGNKINLKIYINGIESRNKYEERLFILKAYLTDKIDEKEKILKKGIDVASENTRLKIFLADIYFIKGDFERATSGYDLAFIDLPEVYKVFYKKRAAIARQFIKNPPKTIRSIESFTTDEMRLQDLLNIIFGESNEVKSYEAHTFSESIKNLKTNGFIHNDTLNKQDIIIKRKDIAYFLLKILSIKENAADLIHKYDQIATSEDSNSLESLDMSPIPDIKMSDYFYTAALILVEREIMELPDGENFFPENPMSATEFYSSLHNIY